MRAMRLGVEHMNPDKNTWIARAWWMSCHVWRCDTMESFVKCCNSIRRACSNESAVLTKMRRAYTRDWRCRWQQE